MWREAIIGNAQTRIPPGLSATLDLARWSVAMLVVLYHVAFNVFYSPDKSKTVFTGVTGFLFRMLTDSGEPAVVWFFVLSGFLVGGGALADIKRNRFAPGRYAAHRVARILTVLIPALLVGLCFDAIRIGLFGLNVEAGGERSESYAITTIIGNAVSLQRILVPIAGSNSPLWTLALEVWYYVIFGLTAAGLAARNRNVALACLAAAFAVLVVVSLKRPALPVLFPIWLVGVAVRLCPRPLIRWTLLSWMLAAAALFGYTFLHDRLGIAYSYLIALTFANALLATQQAQFEFGAGPVRFSRAMADFSFSLYIIHAPVMHLLLTLFNGTSSPRLGYAAITAQSLGLFGAVCLLCVGFAALFAQLVETRTPRVRRWLEDKFGTRTLAAAPPAG